jgi:hypothetical protein
LVQNGNFTVVIWNDAHASLEAMSVDEIKAQHKADRIHTQGYVVVDDETGISICAEWLPGTHTSDDDSYRGTTFILRSNIVEVITVKRPVKRKKKDGAIAVAAVVAPISDAGTKEV